MLNNIISKSAYAVCLSLVFSSCLKDKPFEDQVYGMNGIEDIKLVELTDGPTNITSLDYSTTDTTFMAARVRIGSAQPAPEDIVVTLEIDNSLLDGTAYTAPPSDIYELSNLQVTIPKGEREGSVMITTKPSALSLGQYALGFKVAASSNPDYVISRNYQELVSVLGVKNQYDGSYTNTYVSTLGSGTNNVSLITESPTRVRFSPGLIGVYSNYQALEVDPATNKVTVIMTTLLPVATDPTSNYDPATRTFYLKWTSNGGARQFEQTLVRQ